jgi:hypothetical protein
MPRGGRHGCIEQCLEITLGSVCTDGSFDRLSSHVEKHALSINYYQICDGKSNEFIIYWSSLRYGATRFGRWPRQSGARAPRLDRT